MNKYDEEIAYLTEHPEEIVHRWLKDAGTGGLFRSFNPKLDQVDLNYCPTEIRSYRDHIVPADLYPDLNKFVEDIEKDPRIPICSKDITIEHLPVFKEYQERYDKIMESYAQFN